MRKLEDPAFHDRLNVAQQAGNSAPGQIFSCSVTVGQAGLTAIGFLITLAVLNPVIAAVVLLSAVPGIYSEFDISRQRMAMFAGLSHAQRRQFFYASLLTDYAAAKEIRLFGLGEFFKRRLLRELRSVHRDNERMDRRALAVYAGLAGLSEHRRYHATVLISHRLNAVRDADEILVLSDGIISEQGTHESLMASSGIYARLFSLQAKGYAESAEAGQPTGSDREPGLLAADVSGAQLAEK